MPNTAHGLHYETAGEGSPVLLIMGFSMRGKVWRFQIPDLAERHHVAWFDHRGIGESEPLEAQRAKRWRMGDMAADTLGLLDHLGLERAHIVGVSMGGMVAQHLALAAPQRVRSLSLIATQAGGVRAALPRGRGLRCFLKATRAGDYDARIDALKPLLFPDHFLESAENRAFADRVVREDFETEPPRTTRRAHLRAVLRHRAYRRLGELEGLPTLIVKPAHDLLIKPRQSDRLHRLIPGSRLMTIDDAGHGVVRQSYPALNAALLEHFAAAEAKASARDAA